MNVDSPSKILVWIRTADASVVGDSEWTVNLQGSVDASEWWTITTLSTAIPEDSTGTGYASNWEEVERPDLPQYLRIQIIGDSDNHFYSGHGMSYYVLATE